MNTGTRACVCVCLRVVRKFAFRPGDEVHILISTWSFCQEGEAFFSVRHHWKVPQNIYARVCMCVCVCEIDLMFNLTLFLIH